MLYGELITLAKSLGAVVIENAPMSKYTSFKTGFEASFQTRILQNKHSII